MKCRLVGSVGILGIVTAVLAGQVAAQGNKQGPGPRASVEASTSCTLQGTNKPEYTHLTITTTLTNKSSGGTEAEVRDGSEISGTYKSKDTRGPAYLILGSVGFGPTSIPATLIAQIPLCVVVDNGPDEVRPEVLSARELNGFSEIYYGIKGASDDARRVTNQCTADAAGQGGGIRVADVLHLIELACAAQ